MTNQRWFIFFNSIGCLTPTSKNIRDFLHELAVSESPNDVYRRFFLDMDMESINDVGLDLRRLVIDHVDEPILEFALRK